MPGLAAVWSRRGPIAMALWPVSRLYAGLRWLHVAAYRCGWRRAERLPVPLIVIGNLIAGGAGKTPAVLATAQALAAAGWRPGLISRGYGRRDDGIRHVARDSSVSTVGDEPLLLHLRSGLAVVVGRDRPAAARSLLARHPEVDVLISDDGFQHRALAPDIAVLVFDERGIGNGWLLPAGPLREPLPRRLPPTVLVLYNAPRPSTPLPGYGSQRALAGAVSLAGWWRGEPARLQCLAALATRPVLAVAGLAHPERFFSMLRNAGLEIRTLPLPDHHDYAQLPWPPDTPDVVLTEKDAVKLNPARIAERLGATRIWVVALDFRPAAEYLERLQQLLPAPRAR